jgi:hypothetical protein
MKINFFDSLLVFLEHAASVGMGKSVDIGSSAANEFISHL